MSHSEGKFKRVYIETYGCQMNEYDSLMAESILEKAGHSITRSESQADVILLNTCAVRENAHQKVFNKLEQYGYHKGHRRIGVLGCMAQNLGEELLQSAPSVDFLSGPDSYLQLPEAIQHVFEKEEKVLHLSLSPLVNYSGAEPPPSVHLRSSPSRVTGFVTIQRGCDNFCTFCVVPYTRGRERSRPISEITAEVRALEQAGYKAVVLLGQNVNSYIAGSDTFADLIKTLLRESSIPRIHFTSPHPKDYPEELIDLMAAEPRFAPQAHIPLQAGNNEVLRRMKRNYTAESFLSLIQKMRDRIPGIAFSTDVIVGFPGETQEQFQDTLKVMREADFDSAFMFAYSQRKGTIAARRYPDDVPAEEKQQRLEQLIAEQNERSLRKNTKWIGRRVEILIENISRRNDRELSGRLSNGKQIVFPFPDWQGNPSDYIGRFALATIVSASSATLRGDNAELLSK